MEMINSSVKGKQRLTACPAGTRAKIPDRAAIRLDHRRSLDQWSGGAGRSMQSRPAQDAVRELHARFPQHAAGLVMLHQPGCTADAGTLLNGAYSRLTRKPKHRIPDLSHQVNAAASGVSPP